MCRYITLILTLLFACWLSPEARAAGKAQHVVVVVWDGMRPDFVSESNTPTLYKLAHDGVWFENHHPVFVSATEVNGTAIATGDFPENDGIIANKDYMPSIDPNKIVRTEDIDVIRKGDKLTAGHYLHAATTAEIVRQYSLTTAIAGAKPVALLADRFPRPNDTSPVLFAGSTLPPALADTLIGKYGEFPAITNTSPTRNDWTTQALIDPLWKKGVPNFTLLWLNEPDATQHETGPGSPQSLAAMKNADDNLARVLRALDEKHVRDKTDIMVVSDHGFSTIQSVVDVADSLKTAGFKATREFTEAPTNDDIFVVSDGGCVLLYVIGHDQRLVQKLVRFFEDWRYTGVILTKRPVKGAFTLKQANVDGPGGPDILISMRWTPDKNDAGTPGMIVSDVYNYGPGQGMHGTFSRYDMHNTLVAAGPDFRAEITDHLPTGNVDIAPTVLWILGVEPPDRMDGRVLSEALALTLPGPQIKSYEPGQLRATRELDTNVWHQYLNYTEVNGVTYFEEGNGYQTPK